MRTTSRFRLLSIASALTSLVLVACGSSATGGPSASAQPPVRTPSAPPPPDVQRIDVAKTGVAVYQLVSIPAAVLRNASTSHAALDVAVHFTVMRGGRTLLGLDAAPVALSPGQVMGVAAQCTHGCAGASATDVTVTVGSWTPGMLVTLTPSKVSYACNTCGRGAGQGEVTGTLTARGEPGATPITANAVCYDAAGQIVGAGTRQAVWPSSGNTLTLSAPVIINTPPAACDLFATG